MSMPRGNQLRKNQLITEGPVPSSELDLTPAERKLLRDPDWVTEDEADAIVSMRRERKEGHRGIPLEKVLKRYGYKVEG